MYSADTIVARATAPGAGAVAVVRVSGPRAAAILNAIFKPLGAQALEPRHLALGTVCDPSTGAGIDRALAVIMPGPNSLTGEDVAEIQCHGGPFIVHRIIALALGLGARAAHPGEFSRRAFLNGRIDLAQAEAIADLVAAHSDSALKQALDQLSGALSARIRPMRERLVAIRADLEAEIDFGDENIALPPRSEIAAALERLIDDVHVLRDSFERGRMRRDGVRAAIVGKPNAGKSSVLNLLLGIDRAIVTPVPGTTRDVIEGTISLGSHALVLEDTAGLRESTDEIERIGITRTIGAAASAQLLIAVFDASRPLEGEDLAVIELCRERSGIALLNKRDLPAALPPRLLAERGLQMPAIRICALDPADAGALRDELARHLDLLAGAPGGTDGDTAISNERHRAALSKALAALEAARQSAIGRMPPEIVAVDTALAADALGAITGEIGAEDILDAVFARFCIGK